MQAFHSRRIPYLSILAVVERVVDAHEPASGPLTLEGVLDAERWARDAADRLLAGSVAE